VSDLFRPGEEERAAAELARDLGTLHPPTIVLDPGFAERVMAAIGLEPLPQPARAFGAAVHRRRLGAAIAAIGDAWRVTVFGDAPVRVRAQALVLVLAVAVAFATMAGGAAVGAASLLAPEASRPPSEALPTAGPTPSETPFSSPEPTRRPETAEPSGAPEPTHSAEPTTESTPTATVRPRGETPRPTESDDHGGDDSGGSGSGPVSPTETPDGSNNSGGGD